MKRVASEFQKQAKLKKITYWKIHDCSICGYACAYHIKDGLVYFDNGCYCSNGENLTPRNWEDIAYQYNMQTHPIAIQRMNEFWGFT